MEDKIVGQEEAIEQTLQGTGCIGYGYTEVIKKGLSKKKKSVGDRGRETSAETIKRKRGAPWVSGQSQQWP